MKGRTIILFKIIWNLVGYWMNKSYDVLKALNVHDLFLYHTAWYPVFSVCSSQFNFLNTRKSDLLHLWKVKTNPLMLKGQLDIIPHVWNSLSNDFGSYTYLSLFKKQLKTDMFSKYDKFQSCNIFQCIAQALLFVKTKPILLLNTC